MGVCIPESYCVNVRTHLATYCFLCFSNSTDLADALKHLAVFSDMFSAGRLLSTIRTKLGHPAVYARKDTADIMVSDLHTILYSLRTLCNE